MTILFSFLQVNPKKMNSTCLTMPKDFSIDPFTVDRTVDSNGVFETMRREILD